MRNARTSPLRNHGLKNGTNRDGNEKARKGLGCTRRSIRMDRFKSGMIGNYGPIHCPSANKIARQEPIFPFHEDHGRGVEAVEVWEWHRFFDMREERRDPDVGRYVIDRYGVAFSA